ncbi:MAG: thermonuclease family protein [Acidobacteriota bacterium]
MFTLSKRSLPFLLFALSILTGCSRETRTSAPKTLQFISGTVIKIVDGDTIRILDSQNFQHRIRLKGIDAPDRTQAFYQVSRENLANLLFQKQVRADYEKVDQFGRLIGKVWLEGEDACLEQIKAGLAWHFKKYEKEQSQADQDLYARSEVEAHTQNRGLWKDSNPTPPWDYRRYKTGSIDETEADDGPTSLHHGLTSPLASLKDDPTRKSSSSDRISTNLSKVFVASARDAPPVGYIRGNKRTRIYHWPGCPNYEDIATHNRVPFGSREEAEMAGYRAARNCF